MFCLIRKRKYNCLLREGIHLNFWGNIVGMCLFSVGGNARKSHGKVEI